MIKPRDVLEKEFFTHVPKARKINPIYRGFFDINYKAHVAARPGKKLLNIYASWDLSGERENFYREKFYNECDYTGIDYKEDRFIPPFQNSAFSAQGHNDSNVVSHGDGDSMEGAGFIDPNNSSKPRHQLPYPDASFDIIVTTKYIMEHISEPEDVVREFRRVLKPGGEVFAIAPHIRRQHQPPWDFYRYTEYALRHLFTKSGFSQIELIPTNGFMGVVGYYAYFFQRGLDAPKWIERCFDFLHYWVIEPVCYSLDQLDNGYGRDMTLYFEIRAKV